MSSFFRVLVRDYTAKLQIPPLFVSRFSSLTPKTVVLFCSSERSWMVDIEEEEDKQLYFRRGWNTFVQDNDLEFGDFIVFKFDGNSTFKAKIYEKSYLRRKKTSMSVSSFFKIIINEEYTTKLRIPLLFVSRYSSLVPKTVKFIRSYSSDRSWKVDIVEEDDKRLYYKNGWSTFVEDNAVEIASFIVFKFVGDSTFKVKIYGKCACEKELENESCVNHDYCIQHHNKKIPTLDHQVTKREIDPIDVRYVTMETVDHGDSNQEIVAPQKEVESHVPIEKTDNGYESIEGPDLDSKKNPSFKILLQQAYAKKGVMCFPTEFFHKHMKNKRQEVEMETVEGVWTVSLLPHMKRTRTFARLSKGWSEFAKANHFKTGETLVFELTRKGDCPKFVINRQ
ncbi:hypothetical protein QN277_024825 [Acacia crassicarpa]|uniref:TF-B3 domain-containing protein n=1 Tax=Acacia crassicarpa TaxID=499986 RepID=A0AAE1JG34_9FABA|nr:hypothetical protein QN277_024825 [Acacia crassicarpa]